MDNISQITDELRQSLKAVKINTSQLQRENADLKAALEKTVFLLERVNKTENRTYQDAKWLLSKVNGRE